MTTSTPGDIESVAASLILGKAEDDETKNAAPEQEVEDEVVAEASPDEGADEVNEDELSAAEAEASEEPEPPRYTVKVDGREVEVTLDELTRSYSGQAYVQQRMREAAEARKAVEAEMAQAQQERAMLAQAYAALQQQMAASGSAPQKPPLELLQTDPIRYHEEKAIFDDYVERQQYISLQQQYLMQQQAAADQAQRETYLAEQAQILAEAIPAIADPKQGPELKRKLLEAGVSIYGFSPEDVSSIADARYVKVLHDAYQWRQLQASKGQVLQKAQEARPAVRPGARPPAESSAEAAARAARDRMKRTGKVEDVARFLLT